MVTGLCTCRGKEEKLPVVREENSTSAKPRCSHFIIMCLAAINTPGCSVLRTRLERPGHVETTGPVLLCASNEPASYYPRIYGISTSRCDIAGGARPPRGRAVGCPGHRFRRERWPRVGFPAASLAQHQQPAWL